MYKRKRSTMRYAPYKRPRSSRSVGVMRTGGNYNQVLRRPYAGRFITSQGTERKFNDVIGAWSTATVSIAAGTAGTAATIPLTGANLLNGLAPGTGSQQRIGRKITMKSIQGRVTMTCQNAASGAVPAGTLGGQIRLMIFIDRQSNGAVPLIGDLLELGSGAGFSVQAPYNLNNRERFKVVYDNVKTIDPQNVQSCYFKFYKKMTESVIFNAGSAGSIADIQTGGLFFIIGTNLSSTIGSTAAGVVAFRLRFTDD